MPTGPRDGQMAALYLELFPSPKRRRTVTAPPRQFAEPRLVTRETLEPHIHELVDAICPRVRRRA